MGEEYLGAAPDNLKVKDDALRVLLKKRTFGTLPQTLFNLSAYIFLCSIAAWIDNWWIWIPIWWFQGFILSGFLGASHDCAHNTFAVSHRTNRLAGALWSSSVLFNFTIYKYYHLEHHMYTCVAGDTEPSGVFQSFWDYLKSLPATGFFVAFWIMSFRVSFNDFPHFIRTGSARRAVRVDNYILLFWLLLVITATVVWTKSALIFYWGPMLFYFPMVFLTSLPEHYGCDEGIDLASNTRSMSSNFIFRYMFWNGNYHAEHHVYPFVPSYNLPKLHALIGNYFKFQGRSYILFHLTLIKHLMRFNVPQDQAILTPLKRVDYQTYNSGRGGSQITSDD